jgi:hypothetical protein
MKIHEAIFTLFLVCFIMYIGAFYGRTESKVYVCHEVTESDPKDVQDICKKAPKYQ